MASIGLLGFVKGASVAGLNALERREEAEREMRKAELLERLRVETAKEVADYEELLASKRVDKDLSSIDSASGQRILRNRSGDEVGRVALTDYERQAIADERDKASLDAEVKRANIDQSRASAQYSRTAAANYGKGGGRGGSLDGSNTPDDADIANELMYRYNNEVKETLASGNVSQSAIRSAALAIIQNTRTGQEAQQEFLEFLNNYRTGRKKTEQAKRGLQAGNPFE